MSLSVFWRVMQTSAFAMVFLLSTPSLQAQELKIALSSPPTSLDPHFYALTPNMNISEHLFEALTLMDGDDKIIPGLASSWKNIDDVTWDITLREGAKFSDGSPVTIEDIIWSIDRTETIVNSPGRFDRISKTIVKKQEINPTTLRLTLKDVNPFLQEGLAGVYIVSKKSTQNLSSDDFASGKGLVGSGPFKFEKFQRDDRITMVPNQFYNGAYKSPWKHVTIRFIPNDTTRLAALLSGNIDAIDNIPTADLTKIKNNSKYNFFTKTSDRLIYVYLDDRNETSNFVTDKSGKVLAKNPLKDVRVRKALSMAINRVAIQDRVMEGLSLATGNIVPALFFGHDESIPTPPYDPDGAKKLLAEAGFPEGFGITFHTPNNRYINDEKIAQTIAQMWSRIGVKTKVIGMPMSIYSSRAKKGEFSAGLIGISAQTGEVSTVLIYIAACPNLKLGTGALNNGHYCNPEVDEQLNKAVRLSDKAERLSALQAVSRLVLDDAAIIPLHHQINTWATRKGITYQPRADGKSHAHEFQQE